MLLPLNFAAKFLKTKFLSNSGEHGIETLLVVNWGDLPRKSFVLSSPAAIAFPVDFISRYEHGNFLKISYKTENNYIDTFTSEDLQRVYNAIEINEDGRCCSVKSGLRVSARQISAYQKHLLFGRAGVEVSLYETKCIAMIMFRVLAAPFPYGRGTTVAGAECKGECSVM